MGQALSLAVSIAIPVAGGVLGSIVTVPAVKKWYPTLKKPSWTPPNWLFGPVWTALYTMMGVASNRVFNKGGFEKQAWPLSLYAIQLALNFCWSPNFFGAKKLGLALANITALDVGVAATAHSFWGVDPLASKLLWPYLFWVSYATCLNAYIWWHNPEQKGKNASEDATEKEK